MRKKSFLCTLLIFCLHGAFCQFVSLNNTDELPEFFAKFDVQDSVYEDCLGSWTTNAQWSECNSEAIKYWEAQIDTGYVQVLNEIDSNTKTYFIEYHTAWLKNIEAQKNLFFNLYQHAGIYGREQYLSFQGVLVGLYAERAKDLQYLAYILKHK